mgnify:CR=1 FL=1
MLSLEQLSALDLQAWLGSQKEAASVLGCSQSQISRKGKQGLHLLEELGLNLSRPAAELHDDSEGLLHKLRQVHQWMRFRDRSELRLQSSCWLRHLVLQPLPEGWIANRSELDRFNDRDSLALLQHRVIDAALVTGPERPPDDHPCLRTLVLSRQPLLLLVPQQHVLAQERGLRAGEIGSNSALGHSSFVAAPARRVMERLDQLLIAETPPTRFCNLQGEPPPQARRYGTAMTCRIRPDLTPLDFAVPHPALDVLVVRHDWIEHPAIDTLISVLRQRLNTLKPSIAGLELNQ